jgi:hypothetical protein
MVMTARVTGNKDSGKGNGNGGNDDGNGNNG